MGAPWALLETDNHRPPPVGFVRGCWLRIQSTSEDNHGLPLYPLTCGVSVGHTDCPCPPATCGGPAHLPGQPVWSSDSPPGEPRALPASVRVVVTAGPHWQAGSELGGGVRTPPPHRAAAQAGSCARWGLNGCHALDLSVLPAPHVG